MKIRHVMQRKALDIFDKLKSIMFYKFICEIVFQNAKTWKKN